MTTPTETTPFLAAVLALWGLLDCFFGYRLFKFALALLGAFVGGVLGMTGAMHLFPGNELLAWIGLGIGALLGGILSFAVVMVGVFLAGFALGFVITLGANQATNSLPILATAAAVGLVCGLLGLVLQRWIISAATAWSGAFRVSLAAAFFLNGLEPLKFLRDPDRVPPLLDAHPWIMLSTLALGLLGFFTQLSARARTEAPPPSAEKT